MSKAAELEGIIKVTHHEVQAFDQMINNNYWTITINQGGPTSYYGYSNLVSKQWNLNTQLGMMAFKLCTILYTRYIIFGKYANINIRYTIQWNNDDDENQRGRVLYILFSKTMTVLEFFLGSPKCGTEVQRTELKKWLNSYWYSNSP